MRIKVFNALTRQNLEFELKKNKMINVIYAPNAIGKSSLAKILESAFTTKGSEVIHYVTKEKSKVSITQNTHGISSVFKYDKKYASESAAVYNEKLIIMPKTGTTFVSLKNEIDLFTTNFIKVYNKEIKSFPADLANQKKLLENTILQGSGLLLKSIKSNHVDPLVNLLNGIKSNPLAGTEFTIDDLIEINTYITEELIGFVYKYKEKVDDAIATVMPEISNRDHALYLAIYDFLQNNTNYVNKKCMMCDTTIFTEEMVNNRLAKINEILKNYNRSINEGALKPYEKINSTTFYGNFLNNIKTITRGINASNITESCIRLHNLLDKANISLIKNNFENHILCKVHDLLKNKVSISDYNNNIEKLKKIEQKNKKTINTDIIKRFSEYLKVLGFKFQKEMKIVLSDSGIIEITFDTKDINSLYNEILSESEKTILSLSLFLAIVEHENALIIIDDPVDSHDQKSKFFILHQIYDFVLNNDIFALVLTHDIKFSQMCKYIDDTLTINNLLLTSDKISVSENPSIYFMPLYDYVFDVIEKINSFPNNRLFAIPISILLRYLSKYQNKYFRDFSDAQLAQMATNNIEVKTREDVAKIGFDNVSDFLLHYSESVNLNDLLTAIQSYSIMEFKPNNNINEQTPTNTLNILNNAMDFINDANLYSQKIVPQYANELSLILKGVYLRVLTEMKLLNGGVRKGRQNLNKIAADFRKANPNSLELYDFYIRNKPILNDFCHLDDGIDVIFNYQKNDIEDLITELNSIIV